jgi:hypothetical protein
LVIVPSTVTSMYDLATDLLTAVEAAMATTQGGVPDRAFVSLGTPPWDTSCSYAIVQVDTLTEEVTRDTTPAGQTGMRHHRGRLNLVGMTAWAIRCIQASENNSQNWAAPDDAQLSAEAKISYEDGWAIRNYVNRAIDDLGLFGGSCIDAHMDMGLPVTPEGGLGGWRFSVRVELAGYNPVGT